MLPASAVPNAGDGNVLGPNPVSGWWIRGMARGTDLRLGVLYAGQAHELNTYQIDGTLTIGTLLAITALLARLYGPNHYVVSQTNPHVIPFVTDSKRRQDAIGVWKDAGTKTARALVNASATTLKRPLSLSPALASLLL